MIRGGSGLPVTYSVHVPGSFLHTYLGVGLASCVYNNYTSVWSKIHENLKEYSIQIILDRKRFLPLSRKNQAMTHPLSCFFAAEGPRFNLGACWVVKPLKCVFCDLKGQGPSKTVKNLRKCRGIHGSSIDTTHTPLFFHFTLPLTPMVLSLNYTFATKENLHRMAA